MVSMPVFVAFEFEIVEAIYR